VSGVAALENCEGMKKRCGKELEAARQRLAGRK